jgi:RHS repeat-associated protein
MALRWDIDCSPGVFDLLAKKEEERGRTPILLDTYDYDAFGNKINSTGSTPNSYLYRGEYFDSDLGLYYLRARWMNPLTGRFMSRDPNAGNLIDPKSLHKYTYADGDPVNAVDPSGRGVEIEGLLLRSALILSVVGPKLPELTCTAIEYVDLLLGEDALAKTAITGEEPEGPDNRDKFFELAEMACATTFAP